jgi:flagellar protein FliS
MTKHGKLISAYNSALRTTPPLRLIVLLYDGALVRICSAAEAAYRRDYEKQFNESMRAAQILNGLSCCLDMEKGGKVAISLRDMYQAVVTALLSAVGKKSGGESCQKIASAVRLTRNAWAEIAHMPLAAEPVTITKIEQEAGSDAVFTGSPRSDINTIRPGKPGQPNTDKGPQRLAQSADVLGRVSGSARAVRRNPGSLA